MIAFITVKSSLLPLIEGLCAQGEDGDSRRKSYLFPKIFVTNLQFHQVRFFFNVTEVSIFLLFRRHTTVNYGRTQMV